MGCAAAAAICTIDDVAAVRKRAICGRGSPSREVVRRRRLRMLRGRTESDARSESRRSPTGRLWL
jgi:hypothetical protein